MKLIANPVPHMDNEMKLYFKYNIGAKVTLDDNSTPYFCGAFDKKTEKNGSSCLKYLSKFNTQLCSGGNSVRLHSLHYNGVRFKPDKRPNKFEALAPSYVSHVTIGWEKNNLLSVNVHVGIDANSSNTVSLADFRQLDSVSTFQKCIRALFRPPAASVEQINSIANGVGPPAPSDATPELDKFNLDLKQVCIMFKDSHLNERLYMFYSLMALGHKTEVEEHSDFQQTINKVKQNLRIASSASGTIDWKSFRKNLKDSPNASLSDD